MVFKEIRRHDIAVLAAKITARDARVERGRMYARLACRNGEHGLSDEGLIRLADMFDDGSIVTCAAWLHQMNVPASTSFVKERVGRNSVSHPIQLVIAQELRGIFPMLDLELFMDKFWTADSGDTRTERP